MYSSEIMPSLKEELAVLARRDPKLYEATIKKITQIVNGNSPHHYKNLRHDMKQYKRTHVRNSFVLLFHVDEHEKRITFECLEHHDDVYKR